MTTTLREEGIHWTWARCRHDRIHFRLRETSGEGGHNGEHRSSVLYGVPPDNGDEPNPRSGYTTRSVRKWKLPTECPYLAAHCSTHRCVTLASHHGVKPLSQLRHMYLSKSASGDRWRS